MRHGNPGIPGVPGGPRGRGVRGSWRSCLYCIEVPGGPGNPENSVRSYSNKELKCIFLHSVYETVYYYIMRYIKDIYCFSVAPICNGKTSKTFYLT